MNTRLNIICIIFGIVYLYIIGEFIVSEVIPIFKSSFREGWDDAYNEKEKSESIYFYAIPKEGRRAYPTPLLDTKSGNTIQAEVNHFHAKITNPAPLPSWIVITNGFLIIFSFGMIFLMIFIPVQAYKVIRSIIRNEIFDIGNINRIRKVGYSLLTIFVFLVFFAFISTITAQKLVELADYKIIFTVQEEYTFLIIGLLILLFAEILKISHKMKEEQDLTV